MPRGQIRVCLSALFGALGASWASQEASGGRENAHTLGVCPKLPASGIGETSALEKLLLCAPSLAWTNSLALHTHCPPPPVPCPGMPQVAGVGDAGRNFVQEQLLLHAPVLKQLLRAAHALPPSGCSPPVPCPGMLQVTLSGEARSSTGAPGGGSGPGLGRFVCKLESDHPASLHTHTQPALIPNSIPIG